MPDEQYDPPAQETEKSYDYDSPRGGQVAMTSGMSLGSLRQPTVRSIVTSQIAELRKQLTERESFLKNLDENPSVEKLLDQMRKLHI